MIERRTFSGRGIRYSAATATTAADDNNGDRGGTAPLAPSSATTSRETATTKTAMRTMTTTTTTTIASPTMIESTRAVVLVPHLARCRFKVVVFTGLSWAIRKHVEARAFERHRCADVRAFVLGQGRRDDGAVGIVVGNSGGNVHHGGRGTGDGDGDADDILCYLEYKINSLSIINL
jgi:hypothetical protein